MLRTLFLIGLSVLLLACTSAREKEDQFRIADVNVRLGVGYLKQGRLEDALAKFQKTLDAMPDYPEAHSSIALVYERLEQNDKATEHFERALELNPDDGSTHNNYAVFLCRTGKPLLAEQHFLQAIQSRGYRTPAPALENLGICMLQVPDRDKAEKYLRKALQLNPELPAALLTMAQISLDNEKYMSGRAYLQRYQSLAPLGPDGLWLGVQVETRLGDKAAAREYALQLRKQYPDAAEVQHLQKLGF
jgi:type IV pilus assembly protein PilF